ncbi:MAG TPA: SSI family serine proteinase inhibitor [Sporichthya sp.]|nr:SSI family serine proteinase inhibitor [Sporichthya sp.]
MRYVNVLTAIATVVVGFTGSLTAAQALSLPNPLDETPMPAPVPGLPLDLLPSSETESATKLTVTYRADPKSAAVVMQLTCNPTGGDHPRAAEACERLAGAEQAGTDPFAKPAPDEICTFIYGGPQTATVVGTWHGEGVDAKFSRTNGCEVSRWDAIEPVLSPTAAK